MKRVLTALDRLMAGRSRPQIFPTSRFGVALIGIVDLYTGYEFSLSIFHLAPVALCAWYGGSTAGFAIALIAGATWLAADQSAGHVYIHQAVTIWNAFVRFAFFLITATLLRALRVHLEAERRLARVVMQQVRSRRSR